MKKIKPILIMAIILIIIISITIILNSNKPEISKVCINNSCFVVELAQTQEQKAQGLMYRNSLDRNKGMLFVYETPQVSDFWMKNTLIPLDIIWIDKNKKIIQIAQADPCTQDPCEIYSPNEEALYVLEINQGLSHELGIQVGDEVQIA